jgi:hypothetical protein
VKKLLGILVLGLVLTGNAYAECFNDTLRKNKKEVGIY